MNKKNVIIILLIVFFGGCYQLGKHTIGLNKPKLVADEVVRQDTSDIVYIKDGSIWLETGLDKVSSVDMVINSDGILIDSFVPNGEVFNSTLKNQIADNQLVFTLGVMKPTAELPVGKILVGQINTSGEGSLSIVSGQYIVPAKGDENPKEVKLPVLKILN